MNTIAGESTTSPTNFLKAIDTVPTPEISYFDDTSFKRFTPTGIKIKINLPLVRNSKDPLFGINIDGFIPQYNFKNSWNLIHSNLFPVQYIDGATTVEISQDQFCLPIQSYYASHRMIEGNVGVGLRITSNTTQPGNMIITQASGLLRDYYCSNETYSGLRFSNSTLYPLDYAVGNFMLADLSLNRNISIRSVRKDPNKTLDLAKKIDEISKLVINDTTTNALTEILATQFQEDWLLFAPLSDLPDNTANQLTIEVFFDYSQIQFFVPLFPIIALGANTVQRQILRWTTSFKNKLIATITKDNATYLPAPLLRVNQSRKLEDVPIKGEDKAKI